jgi:hypothetical protein
MVEYAEERRAGGGLVEHGGDAIGHPLRPRPFLIEAAFDELLVGNEVVGAHRLVDLREDVPAGRRIKLYVLLAVEAAIVRVDAAVVVVEFAAPARRVLRIDRRRCAPDKSCRPVKRVRPAQGIERCIVDPADQQREIVAVVRKPGRPVPGSRPRGACPRSGKRDERRGYLRSGQFPSPCPCFRKLHNMLYISRSRTETGIWFRQRQGLFLRRRLDETYGSKAFSCAPSPGRTPCRRARCRVCRSAPR